MSGVVLNVVKPGLYLDSIVLMQLSVELEATPGVAEAVLMIGSEPNKRIMADAGLLADAGREAGANDLVIALRASSDADADHAVAQATALLERRGSSAGAAISEVRPASIDGAVAQAGDANLALISTPGVFAAREARKAITAGLNVMIFSDNVTLEDEVALKTEASARNLLVMGPDCGTAYIGGVPLAFANAISRGSVGVVAASGTGLQEVSVLLTRAGQGLSHGIGVGGRDLSDAVGGISSLRAIDLLDADPATGHIVFISKPPGQKTAARIYDRLARCSKPVTLCLLGIDAAEVPPGLHAVATLKAAVENALGSAIDVGFDLEQRARQIRESNRELNNGSRRRVHGLYAGGTLCAEAQVVFRASGLAVASNAPIAGSPDLAQGGEHKLIDLGSDEYTQGRPHPMSEPGVRSALLAASLADEEVAVVLVDCVLGYGAHEDPAAALVDALRAAPRERPVVIAYVCGTDRDPQGFARQVQALEAAGAIIAPSNADAAALAVRVVSKT